MKTLLIRDGNEPPGELRDLVQAGSTEYDEINRADVPPSIRADRVVVWNGREVTLDDRRLRWPEDEDELRVLFQTGG
jgi:hypothetical protein